MLNQIFTAKWLSCLVVLSLIIAESVYKAAPATQTSSDIKSNFARFTVKPATKIIPVYSDKGTGAETDISVWRADLSADPDFYSLGDVAMNVYTPPATIYIVSAEEDELQPPIDYTQVWDDTGSEGDQPGSFWQPIPPINFTCLGNVAQNGYEKPSTDLIRCVKSSVVRPASTLKIWDDNDSGADRDIGVWEIVPNADDNLGIVFSLFVSNSNYDDPGLDNWVLNRAAIKSGPFIRHDINTKTPFLFAPRIFMHPDESYFPDSPLTFLENVHAEDGFLVTNEALGCDSCSDPPFLDGVRPDADEVPVYGQIIHRKINGEPSNIVDVIYWTFYPYNSGKRICIGLYFDSLGCAGGHATFGNHVGDWEYILVRLVDGYATKIYFSIHLGGLVVNWGDKSIGMVEGNHFIAFSAQGSHGYYPDAASHTYKELPNGDNLNDDTGLGAQWDTWKTLVSFDWQTPGTYSGAVEFMNKQERWGNPKSGCKFSEIVSGECVLGDGPSPPMSKSVADPNNTNINYEN